MLSAGRFTPVPPGWPPIGTWPALVPKGCVNTALPVPKPPVVLGKPIGEPVAVVPALPPMLEFSRLSSFQVMP